MNRAQKMLEVLQDGQRHSRRELFEHCGFFLTNNAASELRAMGHDIEQTRERVNGDVVYYYRLRGSLSQPDQSAGASLLGSNESMHDHDGGRSGSESEPLFEVTSYGMGGRPDWA